jgi:hypothetical protein
MSAKASDVYDWAKKPEAEFKAWVKGLVEVSDIDLSAYATATQIENTYVKKEAGKSLIADTEITRLSGVSNYDDAAISSRVKAIEDDYLKAVDKEGLQTQITTNTNAIERLTNGVSAEEIDGVNDLIDYVNNHGSTVTGLQNSINANAEAITAINHETTGILAKAKAYADSLNHEDTKYTAAAGGGLKLDENNAFSIDDSITFIFDCGGANFGGTNSGTNSDNGADTCPFCGIELSGPAVLKDEHINSCGRDGNTYKCPECGEEYLTSAAMRACANSGSCPGASGTEGHWCTTCNEGWLGFRVTSCPICGTVDKTRCMDCGIDLDDGRVGSDYCVDCYNKH